jgi:hypothetical protein
MASSHILCSRSLRELSCSRYELVRAVVKWEERKVTDAKYKANKKIPAGSGGGKASAAEEEEEIVIGTPAEVDEEPPTEEEDDEDEEDLEQVVAPLAPELAALAAAASFAAVEASCRAGLALDASKVG